MVIMQLAESVMRLGGAEARRLEKKVIRPTTPVREDPGYVGTSHPCVPTAKINTAFCLLLSPI